MAIPRVVNQPGVPTRITARSLLLVSSGTVRKCEKESMMAKFKKRLVKWGLSAAKVGLAASILAHLRYLPRRANSTGLMGLILGRLSSVGWKCLPKCGSESASP